MKSNYKKNIEVNKIKGKIAILCNEESLLSASSLIKDFNEINDISLYIENNNKIFIYDKIDKAVSLNSPCELQLECSLNQCFSPIEYSCTVCIGENECFSSIADSCRKYATPVYILKSYCAA